MTVRTATLVRSTDQAILDRLCSSPLDWLMLDGEHASVGLDEMAAMLRGIRGRLPAYARVRALDEALITHALAHGAAGIIVPNVDTAEQAAESVRVVRDSAWPAARVVVQAESAAAVEHITAIVAVPGIEWVLIGPYDLTRSLGIPEQFEAPAFHDAVRIIERACETAAVPVGIFGMTPERVAPYIATGHTWVVVGIDRAG
ncbi:MAG: aldolase/citrate lyase family protein [Gemmatimonadota bacterium]|nr:aldolase/citrate lyase family protein [Gemmatimonadota bacterium]